MTKKRKIILILVIVFSGINYMLSMKYAINFRRQFTDLGVPANFVEHHNAIGGFSISLPESWPVSEMPMGKYGDKSVVMVGASFLASPYIEASRYENIQLLAEIENLTFPKIQEASQNTYRLVDREEYSSQPASILHEYLITKPHRIFGKREFHCLDWYTISKKNTGYSFSFCVEDKNWEKVHQAFLEIIDSIKFE